MWYSKDGERYESRDKWAEANARYEQHQEQKKLLAEQNQLLAQQAQINVNLEKERIRNELYLESQRRDMQKKQMEHEEKMRILKLFDDVGITKDTFDNFLSFLFPNKNLIVVVNKENRKKMEYEEKLKNMDKYLKKPEDYVKILFPDFDDVIELRDTLEKYLENKNDIMIKKKITDYFDTKPNDEYKIYKEALSKTSKKYVAVFATEFLSILLLALTGSEIFAIPLVISLILIICSLFQKADDYLTPAVNEKLTYVNNIIDTYTNLDNVKEIILKTKKETQELIKNTEKNINNLQKDIKETSKKWNSFIEFRKRHYNSKIEKLLIDAGLKDIVLKLDLEYPKINSNNKISDGTTEDYITYFDEFEAK